MNTVIVRKIDHLGRIVVPAETRRLFKIDVGDELAISVERGSIVIRKLEAICVFCGSTDSLSEYEDRGICADCQTNIAAL